MLQEVSKEIPSTASIATKKPKTSKDSFSNFIANLGKTDSKAPLDSKTNAKTEAPNTNIKKDAILANLLKNKNEEKPISRDNLLKGNTKTKIAQKSPLDEILQRPKATSTKLNKIPEVRGANFTPNDKVTSKDIALRELEEKNATKVNADSTNNPQTSLDSTKNNDIKSPKTLQPQNSQPQQSQAPQASNASKLSPQDLANAKEIVDLEENVESSNMDSKEKSENLASIKKDSKPPLKKEDIKTLPTPQEKMGQENILDNATDSNALESSNIAMQNNASNLDSTLDSPPKPQANLGIKNTLKYGAFAAFDALSLLKPSDGKKLSDLIKKADELSLNLEKMKYQKIDSKNTSINTPINNAKITPLKEDSKEVLKDLLADSKSEPTKAELTQNPKVDTKAQEIKQDSKNDIPTPSKDTKTADSKQVATKNEQNTNEQNTKSTPLADNKTQVAQDKPQNQEKPQVNTTQENIIDENKQALRDAIKPASLKLDDKKIDDKLKKPQDSSNPLDSTNALKNEQSNKIFDAKETMRSFATALKQEIVNYKPPLSKITLELNPANLGSVEVSITSQGKNLQLQLNANQNTLNLFIQHQSELRASLSQVGYDNITFAFSNGSQMGFSDSSGKWSYFSQNELGNKNSLDDEEGHTFDITIINNYA